MNSVGTPPFLVAMVFGAATLALNFLVAYAACRLALRHTRRDARE